MFDTLAPVPADPILSVAERFRHDPRPNKMDLSVGVYRDEHGITPVMAAVREAERRLLAEQTTKAYVGMAGNARFNRAVEQLVLGEQADTARWTTLQTPGGSGALRLLAELIAASRPDATIWISDPSYVNHAQIMRSAGLSVRFYPYLDPRDNTLRRDAFFDTVAGLGPQDVLLLHGCCHNPSGVDLALADWQRLAGMATTRGFIPFVDMAYQGFGDGIEQDAAGLRLLADAVDEMLVVYSCSKHFGLYRERTGAALVRASSPDRAPLIRDKLFEIARRNYTMPPDHGAELVARIMDSAELTAMWRTELDAMRQRVLDNRDRLATALAERGVDASYLRQHRGMFSMLPLDDAQIAALREQHGVYIVGGGRTNLAGVDAERVEELAAALAAVMRG